MRPTAWERSLRLPEQIRQIAHHGADRDRGRAHRRNACRGDGDQAPRLAAPLGTGLTESGPYETLGFEPLERGVDVGVPDRAPGALPDVVRDGDRVGLVRSQPEGGEKDQQFELREGLWFFRSQLR